MATKIDRLKSQLLTSGIQQKNPALFQVVDQLIAAVTDVLNTLNSASTSSGGGTDISDQDFLTSADDSATLPNSRELLAGLGVTFDDSTPNERTVAIASGVGFLTGTGNPQGVQSSGLGAYYVDTNNGYVYRKNGGGSTAYGWYVVPLSGSGIFNVQPWNVFVPATNLANVWIQTSDFGWLSLNTGVAPFTNVITPSSYTKTIVNNLPHSNSTCTASTGSGGILRTLGATGWPLLLDYDCDYIVNLVTGSDVTNIRIWFVISNAFISQALGDTLGTGKVIGIRYSTTVPDGGWVGFTNSGSANAATSILATIAANTQYRLRIRFVRSGTPTVYYSVDDGTEIAVTANIPATGSVCYMQFGYITQSNTAKSLGWNTFGLTLTS